MTSIPELNKSQLDKLSDICSDSGILSVGSIAVPALFDKFNILLAVVGTLLTIILWIVSLWLRR